MPIPNTHRAGTSLSWSYSVADYTPLAGYVSTLHLTPPATSKRQECILLQATADSANTGWVVTAAASRSANWSAGTYQVDVEVTKSDDAYVPLSASLRVLSALGSTPEQVGALRLQLVATDAAIEAVIAGQGIQEMKIQTTVGEREMSYMSLAELRNHRSYLVQKIGIAEYEAGMRTTNKTSWRPVRTYMP